MFERKISVRSKYLFFPISNDEKKYKVFIKENGETAYDVDLRLSGNPDYITWLDVEDKTGRELGFACEEDVLSLITQGDELPGDLYQETDRPHYHFTPLRGWVNDPNGLTYANGKYHLFYQHNPYDTRWGNMHWGHSHSDDLFHWIYDGEALFPDQDGTMFSGAAVFDGKNVSGLGTDRNPPVLLFYTCAGGDNAVSSGKKFTVCVAYSTDGKTFRKYGKGPVVQNIVFGNRDPKVVWHEESRKWIMILFLQPYEFAFLSSDNLLDWKMESVSEFPTMNECPDLFPVGQTGKWAVLAGADYWGHKSVGKYVIGDFDGKTFSVTDGPYPIDFGREFYSLQTFDNDPKGRRVLIGWRTRNFYLPAANKMPFQGEYSVPTELKPCVIDGKVRLGRYPVEEFFTLCRETIFTKREPLVEASKKDAHMIRNLNAGESFALKLSFKPKNNLMVVVDVAGAGIVYDSEMQTLQCMDKNVPVPPEEDGTVEMLILRDTQSIELFAQGGKYPVSGYIEPHGDEVSLDLYRGDADDFFCEIKAVEGIFKKT